MTSSDDPVEGLRQCRDQFRANLGQLYSLIGAGYEMALRLLEERDARTRFFDEEYFKHTRVWGVRAKRDLYREVFKYLLDAYSLDEKKRASKFASVVWHLDCKNIPPDAAASTIKIYHGIDAIARHGIPDPVILDPRDVGDGMTATGETINYDDEDDEESDESSETEMDNPPGEMVDHSPSAEPDQSQHNPEGSRNEAGVSALRMQAIGSARQLQELSSALLGHKGRMHFTLVETDGVELVIEVRRVVLPKLTGWSGIRPIIRDDEEWYAADEWEYPEELCD